MGPQPTDTPVREWLKRRTLYPGDVDPGALAARKRSMGLTVSVCLPARNEEATIGPICGMLRDELVTAGAIDQVIVMDSRSTDSTAEIAQNEGADVYAVADVLTDVPGFDGGKGEALWKSLAVASGDIIVWADSDILNFTSGFVTGLIEPLLADDSLALVKGFYDRPLVQGEATMASGGARVTELAARPLLNLFYPELAGVIQPLSGEYAVRADAARAVPFLSGYASDIGLLIWFAEEYGMDRIAQVDLGTRLHRNQDIFALGRMAHQVMQGMLRTFDHFGRVKLIDEPSSEHAQFVEIDGRQEVDSFDLQVVELPRMNSYPNDDASD
jgi:glucosyl-3-phosphoglycerate synthase